MEKLGEFRESLKSTDWAWISGYLDGEGCFMLRKAYIKNPKYKKTKIGIPGWYYYSPRIMVVSGDRKAIEFIAKAFCANVAKRKVTNPKFRPMFSVEVSAIQTLRSILKQILPYLKAKNRQAECLYRFTSTPRPNGPNRKQIREEREKLYNEFRVIAEECGQADAGRPERFREKTLRKIQNGFKVFDVYSVSRNAIKSGSVTLSQATG